MLWRLDAEMLRVGSIPGTELGSATLTAQGVHDKHDKVFLLAFFVKAKFFRFLLVSKDM